MHNIVVTLKSNVQKDEEGNFLEDEDGELLLIDENDVGIIAKSHVMPFTQQVGNEIQTGLLTRAEVYWNLVRCPAPAMIAPEDLVWISIEGADNEDDPDEEMDEDED